MDESAGATSLAPINKLQILAAQSDIWYQKVPYGTIWYLVVPYGTIWYHMVLYGTIWYHVVPYVTIQSIANLRSKGLRSRPPVLRRQQSQGQHPWTLDIRRPTERRPTIRGPTTRRPTERSPTVRRPTIRGLTIRRPTVRRPIVGSARYRLTQDPTKKKFLRWARGRPVRPRPVRL